MQCSMCNQCSGLFTCIMNYLHVLCMIFMVLSCVLCMTLMVFIYVYYGLFACTNLVDTMSLFFMIFSFYLPIFDKKRSISSTNRPEIATPVF
jgi:small-conductance mechanosensitive channel